MSESELVDLSNDKKWTVEVEPREEIMSFKDVSNKVDFVDLEQEILDFWQETDAFNELRRLRAKSDRQWSFLDGPITANNPMGVHHAWGRTYKDLYQRFWAMRGYNERWQNGFDCQGLWVEVEVEKELGFTSKRDIEEFGLAEFVKLCKMRVLNYAAVQTEQSIRLGYWMDWNDPSQLYHLAELMAEDQGQVVQVQGADGPVKGTLEEIVGRLGTPALGGSYFTFSDENNYQIWGFLQKCHQNGWLYKGRDVMPWCARCGTGISQHEIVTDGYQEVTHDSVYLRFPLLDREKEALLVWTTTPWTLTSNVAAAVGPDLDYVKVAHKDGWTYYLAEEAMKESLIGEYEVVDRLKGQEMVGWRYKGPFDELPAAQEAFSEAAYQHRVILWKEVGAGEGTGIVHIAPGCGAEDFELSQEHDLPVIAPLDESGHYISGFNWLDGRSVHDVAGDIFEDLYEKGLYYRKQRYPHRYPHCWRCGEELVYRLVDEWFISMGEVYDKPRQELTEAEKAASLRYQIMDVVDEINWIPGFGYDREMDWLRNMQDWMISKKRYWGLALPIWTCQDQSCGHFEVIGSEEELEERAVEGWDEFQGHTPHRPYIDAVKVACSRCGGRSSRIADVGNPWLDAGIVAYSTLHYRENPDYWEEWFPADFITESFPGQFRNWFYSLLAQSTVLTGRAPFKNVLGFATLLAEDGRAMHKSWGNAIEFNEAADSMGADVMRWLYLSHKPEQNLLFGYTHGDETRRRFLIPLWNVYAFFISYAQLDEWTPDDSVGTVHSPETANTQLDQWIVERLDETTVAVNAHLEKYAADRATEAIEAFLDDLSNWYVRRSRRRFWKSEADQDKAAAYATLYHVLVELTKLLAPFVPFTTEAMYQNLVRSLDAEAPMSVHHCFYPEAEALDRRLLDKMRLAITTAGLGRSARSSADIKLRQPLAKARVNVATQQERDDLLELAEVLKEEINVKELQVVSEVGELVNYKLLPNNRVLGPRYGKRFPKVRAALAELDAAEAARKLQAGELLALAVEGEAVTLSGDDVLVQTEARGGLAVASDKGVTVAVDTELTPALAQEGYARDLVRTINNMRKEAGLDIADRIHLAYEAEGDVADALQNFADYIQEETLALSLTADSMANPLYQETVAIDNQEVVLALQKA
jgi:isoleucyl-tRNA synthetase